MCDLYEWSRVWGLLQDLCALKDTQFAFQSVSFMWDTQWPFSVCYQSHSSLCPRTVPFVNYLHASAHPLWQIALKDCLDCYWVLAKWIMISSLLSTQRCWLIMVHIRFVLWLVFVSSWLKIFKDHSLLRSTFLQFLRLTALSFSCLSQTNISYEIQQFPDHYKELVKNQIVFRKNYVLQRVLLSFQDMLIVIEQKWHQSCSDFS